MSDLLKEGLEFLEEQRKLYMTESVTYRRGTATAEVLATIGKTRYEVDDEAGMKVGTHLVDFLITATDLVIAGTAVIPKLGDEIDYDGKTYSVLHIPGEGCWRWSDPHGNTYRIHTRYGS
jgi:hypothetical protein